MFFFVVVPNPKSLQLATEIFAALMSKDNRVYPVHSSSSYSPPHSHQPHSPQTAAACAWYWLHRQNIDPMPSSASLTKWRTDKESSIITKHINWLLLMIQPLSCKEKKRWEHHDTANMTTKHNANILQNHPGNHSVAHICRPVPPKTIPHLTIKSTANCRRKGV